MVCDSMIFKSLFETESQTHVKSVGMGEHLHLRCIISPFYTHLHFRVLKVKAVLLQSSTIQVQFFQVKLNVMTWFDFLTSGVSFKHLDSFVTEYKYFTLSHWNKKTYRELKYTLLWNLSAQVQHNEDFTHCSDESLMLALSSALRTSQMFLLLFKQEDRVSLIPKMNYNF